MKLTNFGSVVKTYKKNFLIRKEKFIAERKAIQEKKKRDREELIETQKRVAPLIKLKVKFGFLILILAFKECSGFPKFIMSPSKLLISR